MKRVLADDDDDEPEDGDVPVPKAPRISAAGGQQFVRGQIMHIRLRNFMTYAGPVEVHPGPRLNLILGPNGSGKSSLVCAICLGLAGSPKARLSLFCSLGFMAAGRILRRHPSLAQLLGRAGDVGQYVKNGASDGEVQITLATGDPRRPELTVTRKIFTNDKSEWKLNGACFHSSDVPFHCSCAFFLTMASPSGTASTLHKVEDTMKQFSVQLDNLCQARRTGLVFVH